MANNILDNLIGKEGLKTEVTVTIGEGDYIKLALLIIASVTLGMMLGYGGIQISKKIFGNT